ncbi:hypothetical protein ACIF9R_20500 [Streptomyces sp. NPDC086080]|uniref:hypothetical protein n=1 Tax=Streptomyces sp. NPDC086080 TaxID=3365748 RepID=UPI0037D233DC
MGHVEPAHLVELALGRTTGDQDVRALRHIATCPRCRRELASMIRVVTAARDAGAADLPTAPPEHVWRRIVQELSGEEPSDADTAPPRSGRSPLRRPAGLFVVRWFRIGAGGEPARRPGRRLRSPWWRRGR